MEEEKCLTFCYVAKMLTLKIDKMHNYICAHLKFEARLGLTKQCRQPCRAHRQLMSLV